MKIAQNLCVLVWLRKSKSSDDGLSPIYLRITIGGARVDISLGKKVAYEKWLAKAGIMKGNSEEARTLNNYINFVKGEIQKNYNFLLTQHDEVTPEMVRNTFLGVKEEKKTIIKLIEYHNQKFKEKVEIGEFSDKTHDKYLTTLLRTEEFIKFQYKLSDIALAELNFAFITNFEHFLRTKKFMQSNSAMKHIKNLKKIIRMAISLDWLQKNPFENFKCSYKQPNIDVLTQEDLDNLYQKETHLSR